MLGSLSAIWRFRYFIVSAIFNEFRSRFIRSRLGGLWMILNPLAQVAIFAFVLSAVFSSKMGGTDIPHAYPRYLMAGTLVWTLFAEVIIRCLTLFIDNGNLMKKLAFPRICLPVIGAGSALLNNVFLLVATIIVMGFLGGEPCIADLWLPLILVETFLLALGIGLVLGIFNVFMRDIGQVVPIVLQIMQWLTPIIWTPAMVPPFLAKWAGINPMFHLVRAAQSVLLYSEAPHWRGMLVVAGLTLALLGLALSLFRRASPDMVDVL